MDPAPESVRPLVCSASALSSVSQARRWLVDADFAGDLSVVELLVSELVTNAVLHGAPPVVLALDGAGGRVTVAVDDGNVIVQPTVRRDDLQDRIGGHGLSIVETPADDWGCQALGSGRKSLVRARRSGDARLRHVTAQQTRRAPRPAGGRSAAGELGREVAGVFLGVECSQSGVGRQFAVHLMT